MLDESLSFYQKSLELDANFTDSLIGLASILDLKGNAAAALVNIEKALELQPDNVDYLFFYADLLQDLKEIDKSIEVYNKLLSITPLEAEVWLDYSEMLFVELNALDAMNLINEGININPEKVELHYRKAAYEILSGKINAGLLDLDHALSLDPKKVDEFLDFNDLLGANEAVMKLINSFNA
jgi:superkiller protein 3